MEKRKNLLSHFSSNKNSNSLITPNTHLNNSNIRNDSQEYDIFTDHSLQRKTAISRTNILPPTKEGHGLYFGNTKNKTQSTTNKKTTFTRQDFEIDEYLDVDKSLLKSLDTSNDSDSNSDSDKYDTTFEFINNIKYQPINKKNVSLIKNTSLLATNPSNYPTFNSKKHHDNENHINNDIMNKGKIHSNKMENNNHFTPHRSDILNSNLPTNINTITYTNHNNIENNQLNDDEVVFDLFSSPLKTRKRKNLSTKEVLPQAKHYNDQYANQSLANNPNVSLTNNNPKLHFANNLSLNSNPTIEEPPVVFDGHRLVPMCALEASHRSVFRNYDYFNAVQSKCFNGIYKSDENAVISAPTGCGKTAIFELALLRTFRQYIRHTQGTDSNYSEDEYVYDSLAFNNTFNLTLNVNNKNTKNTDSTLPVSHRYTYDYTTANSSEAMKRYKENNYSYTSVYSNVSDNTASNVSSNSNQVSPHLTKNKKKCKAIYICPLKALCEERYHDWHAKFTPLGLTVAQITGDNTNVASNEFDMSHTDIIITTPEKWDSITRRWTMTKSTNAVMDNIGLLMIDEVHILGEDRGACLEGTVTRCKMMKERFNVMVDRDGEGHVEGNRLDQCCGVCFTSNTKIDSHTCNNSDVKIPAIASLRIIALSATIPNTQDISLWLNAKTFQFGSEYRPVPLQLTVRGYPPAKSDFLFINNLNYRVFDILRDFSEDRPSLVFCPTRKDCLETAKRILEDAEKVNGSGRSVFVSDNGQRMRLATESRKLKEKSLSKLVEGGVGVHSAGLLYQDRCIMEELFRQGDLRVLCTTSTLAQGVNLPAHLVVIKGTQQYIKGKGFVEYLPGHITQMIGRAGRPQFDTYGKAVIMTEQSLKHRYERMEENEVISTLGGNGGEGGEEGGSVGEHLNAEIVLKTVKCQHDCERWLKNTYYYVTCIQKKLRSRVQGMVHSDHSLETRVKNEVEKLFTNGLIDIDQRHQQNTDISSGGSNCVCEFYKSTSLGELITKYYLKTSTAEVFLKSDQVSNFEDLLWLVSECDEYQGIQIRMGDKGVLNEVNKQAKRVHTKEMDFFSMLKSLTEMPKGYGAAVGVCYPMKKSQVSVLKEKVFLLFQIALASSVKLPGQDLVMDTETVRQGGGRVCGALSEYMMSKGIYIGTKLSILLRKSCDIGMWGYFDGNNNVKSKKNSTSNNTELSPEVLQTYSQSPLLMQLDGIGIKYCQILADSGIRNFSQLAESGNTISSLEGIRDRNLWSKLNLSLRTFPQYTVTVDGKTDQDSENLFVTLHFTVKQENPNFSIKSKQKPSTTILVGDFANRLVYRYNWRLSVGVDEWSFSVRVRKGSKVGFDLIDKHFIGIDLHRQFNAPGVWKDVKIHDNAKAEEVVSQDNVRKTKLSSKYDSDSDSEDDRNNDELKNPVDLDSNGNTSEMEAKTIDIHEEKKVSVNLPPTVTETDNDWSFSDEEVTTTTNTNTNTNANFNTNNTYSTTNSNIHSDVVNNESNPTPVVIQRTKPRSSLYSRKPRPVSISSTPLPAPQQISTPVSVNLINQPNSTMNSISNSKLLSKINNEKILFGAPDKTKDGPLKKYLRSTTNDESNGNSLSSNSQHNDNAYMFEEIGHIKDSQHGQNNENNKQFQKGEILQYDLPPPLENDEIGSRFDTSSHSTSFIENNPYHNFTSNTDLTSDVSDVKSDVRSIFEKHLHKSNTNNDTNPPLSSSTNSLPNKLGERRISSLYRRPQTNGNINTNTTRLDDNTNNSHVNNLEIGVQSDTLSHQHSLQGSFNRISNSNPYIDSQTTINSGSNTQNSTSVKGNSWLEGFKPNPPISGPSSPIEREKTFSLSFASKPHSVINEDTNITDTKTQNTNVNSHSKKGAPRLRRSAVTNGMMLLSQLKKSNLATPSFHAFNSSSTQNEPSGNIMNNPVFKEFKENQLHLQQQQNQDLTFETFGYRGNSQPHIHTTTNNYYNREVTGPHTGTNGVFSLQKQLPHNNSNNQSQRHISREHLHPREFQSPSENNQPLQPNTSNQNYKSIEYESNNQHLNHEPINLPFQEEPMYQQSLNNSSSHSRNNKYANLQNKKLTNDSEPFRGYSHFSYQTSQHTYSQTPAIADPFHHNSHHEIIPPQYKYQKPQHQYYQNDNHYYSEHQQQNVSPNIVQPQHMYSNNISLKHPQSSYESHWNTSNNQDEYPHINPSIGNVDLRQESSSKSYNYNTESNDPLQHLLSNLKTGTISSRFQQNLLKARQTEEKHY